jgi:hypothetical protein
VARFSVGVKGVSTSVPASLVGVLLVADITRMVELRVREGTILMLVLMLEVVLDLGVCRVAGFCLVEMGLDVLGSGTRGGGRGGVKGGGGSGGG